MWCTRWFIPLMILPLPTAPPYFLMVFMFSLALHSRPCFYCMVMLTILFSSSCYWQPVPLSTSLSFPVPMNVTTLPSSLLLSQLQGSNQTMDESVNLHDGQLIRSFISHNATTITTYATTFGAYILHNLTASFPDAVKEISIVLPEEGQGVLASLWKMVTDFASREDKRVEAVANATSSETPRFTLPSAITLTERCWCGLTSTSPSAPVPANPSEALRQQTTSGSIFNPTSIRAWERATLERVLRDVRAKYLEVVKEARANSEKGSTVEELLTKQGPEDRKKVQHSQAVESLSISSGASKNGPSVQQDQREAPQPQEDLPLIARIRHTLRSWSIITFPRSPSSLPAPSPGSASSMPQTALSSRTSTSSSYLPTPNPSSSLANETQNVKKRDPTRPDGHAPEKWNGLPWLRKEYDFLPYGVDLVLDFRWDRNSR